MNTNNVNHPRHYNQYPTEVIDMMVAIWGKEKTITFCMMNAFKYRMRLGLKGCMNDDIQEDLAKEQWYLNKAEELGNTIVDTIVDEPEDEHLPFKGNLCKKCGKLLVTDSPIPYCTDCETLMDEKYNSLPNFHPEDFKGLGPSCKHCGEDLQSNGLCSNCDPEAGVPATTRRKRR